MKKLNLVFIFIFLLMFQVNSYAQKTDFYSFFGIDSKAEEILELRTETSKTFLNPDGSRTAIIFTVPVHQMDVNYMWEDIYSSNNDLIEIPSIPVTLQRTQGQAGIYWAAINNYFGAGQFMAGITERVYLRWDTGVIPDFPVGLTAKLSFAGGIYPQGQDNKFDLAKINIDYGRIPAGNNEIFYFYNDCSTDIYTRYDLSEQGGVTNYFENDTNFRNDLVARLSSNWMALGVMNYPEWQYITGTYVSPLIVNYTSVNVPQLFASPSQFTFNSGDTSHGFTVSNNGEPGTINFSISENADWVTLNPPGSTGATPKNYTVSVTENTAQVDRSATITIVSSNSGVRDSVQYVNITQRRSNPPNLKVSPTSILTSVNGGSHTINVTDSTNSNTINYTVSTNVDWLSVPSGSANTPSSFTVTSTGNYTGAGRSGRIIVSTTDPQAVVPTRFINVIQGAAKTLTLPTQEVAGLQTYLATNWIVANSFLVGSGGNVPSLVLGAGNKITLKPGFRAKSDAGTFRAYIHNFPEEQENLIVGINEEERVKNSLSMKGKGKNGETDNIIEEPIPTEYDLFQNYPNPFNPTTNIKFALPERSYVTLAVYNLIGQKVAELTNNELEAGYHTIQFNGSMLSSGLYFYRVTTNKFSKTYKMLLVK